MVIAKKTIIIAICTSTIVAVGLGIGLGVGLSSSHNAAEINAKNIMFRSTERVLAESSPEGSYETSIVYADQVKVDVGTGSLVSKDNLQDALDLELAVDLNKLLPGTRWRVTNKYSGMTENTINTGLGCKPTEPGTITFSNEGKTFSIDIPVFAAAGICDLCEEMGSTWNHNNGPVQQGVCASQASSEQDPASITGPYPVASGISFNADESGMLSFETLWRAGNLPDSFGQGITEQNITTFYLVLSATDKRIVLYGNGVSIRNCCVAGTGSGHLLSVLDRI